MNPAAILIGLVVLVSLCAVVGGIWALLKQQIVVDESGAVSEVDIPFFGKLRTNYPSLIAVVLGIALAWAVQSNIRLERAIPTLPLNASLTLTGVPTGNFVFVSAIPEKYLRVANISSSLTESKFVIDVDEPGPYNVMAFAVSGVRSDGRPTFTIVHGPATLRSQPREFEFNGILNASSEQP